MTALSTKPTDSTARSADRPEPPPESATLGPWDAAAFRLAHATVAILLRVLTLSGLYRFGVCFGTMEWIINHGRRRRFARALGEMLDQPASPRWRRRITLRHFQQTRCDKLLYLIMDRVPRDQIQSRFTISGRELLDQALARGRGAYIALSHHGPHHVVAMLMAMHGYRVAGVRDRREGAMRRFVQRRFDRLYPEFRRMRVLFADSYPRDVFRCFQENYVLGSSMDANRRRHPNQTVETVRMFGKTQPFLSGPLRVARRCGATALQGFLVPQPDFHYRLELVDTLLDPHDTRPEEVVIPEAMQRYASSVEARIRNSPWLITRG